MKGYCLIDIREVFSLKKLGDYQDEIRKVTEQYGGRYLIIGGSMNVVEGNPYPHLLVLIEFSSYERAHQWFYSAERTRLNTLRESAFRANCTIIEGL